MSEPRQKNVYFKTENFEGFNSCGFDCESGRLVLNRLLLYKSSKLLVVTGFAITANETFIMKVEILELGREIFPYQ